MTVYELGLKLSQMYSQEKTNKVAIIHLFGIIYDGVMRAENIKAVEVIKAAKMPESYVAEINK